MKKFSKRRASVLATGIATMALGWPGAVRATDVPADEPAEPVRQPKGGIYVVDDTMYSIKQWFKKFGLTVSSGLDVSYQYDFNNPGDDIVSQRLLEKNHDTGGVDLWMFSIGKDFVKPGEYGFYLKFFAGRFAGWNAGGAGTKSDWNGSGYVGDTNFERQQIDLPEAYIGYVVPVGNGITLKGGKLATLVGNEYYEPWLNPIYSHSFIFDFAQPGYHTGGYASYPIIQDVLTVTAGGVMGWDNVEDANDSPSAIGQIAYTPNGAFGAYVSGIYGPEQSCNPATSIFGNGSGCNRNKRGLVDAVINIKPMDNLLWSTNFDWASEDEASLKNPGQAAAWVGVASTVSYMVTDWLQYSLRAEYFDDTDGSRTVLTNGEYGQRLWAITPASLKFMLTDYFYLRGEYRYDSSSSLQAFTRGQNGSDNQQSLVSFDFGYYF